MTTGLRVLGIGFGLLLASADSQAATRLIQFGGIAGSQPMTDEGNTKASTAFCFVLVTNTGMTRQKVSASFIGYSSQLQMTSDFTTPAAGDTGRYRRGQPSTDCSGTNNEIGPGEYCIFRSIVNTISFDGHWGVCTGRVRSDDVDPAQPGSVVAAGTVSIMQEARVLGGVLSGAYYASGTHLSEPELANISTYGRVLHGVDIYNTHNMNIYCSAACAAGGLNPAYCAVACGHGAGVGEKSSPTQIWSAGIQGYIQPLDDTWTDPIRHHAPDQTKLMPNMFLGPSPSPSGAPSYRSFSPGYNVANPAANGQMSQQPPTMAIRTTNGHFAGGMVYEMEIGPLMSICSGNKEYENNGGQDFTHFGGVDGHSWIKGNPAGNFPPERLLCNHRHAQSDLYMGISASQIFSINGGMPF